MSTSAQPTIICNVNCACAPQSSTTKEAPAVAGSGNTCAAKSSCAYSEAGTCSCKDGVCEASNAKKNCSKAAAGTCSCASGVCEMVESCSNKPACGCAPGSCKANAAA